MIDKSPDRSPLGVAKALKDIIKGKTVCDVGCRNGDLLLEFKKYAKEVIGVESQPERCEVCKKLGLNVVNELITWENIDKIKYDVSKLPKADVYYIWIAGGVNIEICKQIKDAIVVLGGDPSVGEVYKLGGEKITLEYNEGNGVRQKGIFELTVIDKRESKNNG